MHDQDAWKYDPSYQRMAEYFGLNPFERLDYKIAKQISVIADWAGIEKTGDVMTTLQNVRRLQREMGTTFQGKPLVQELYRQIRLGATSPEQTIKRELKAELKKEYEAKLQDAVKETASKVAAKIKRELKKDAAPPPISKPDPEPEPTPEPTYIYGYDTPGQPA